MLRPGIRGASPSESLSTPAHVFSSGDLPEPFRPRTPILAPGKKLRDTPLRISRFGGTILPRRFIVKTYCAIWVTCERDAKRGAKPRASTRIRNARGPEGSQSTSRRAGGGRRWRGSAGSGILLARTDHEVIRRIAPTDEHGDGLDLVELGHGGQELLGRVHLHVADGQDDVAFLDAGARGRALDA